MIKNGDIICADDGSRQCYAFVEEVCDTFCEVAFVNDIFNKSSSKGTIPLSAIKTVWGKQVSFFHQIAKSAEDLAHYLVFNKGVHCWESSVVYGSFRTYEEALAATVAKLKEGC